MRRFRFAVLVFFCLALPSVAPGKPRPAPRRVYSAAMASPAEGKARVYVFQFASSHDLEGGQAALGGPVVTWTPAPFLCCETQLFDGHSYVGIVDHSQYYGFDLDPGPHLLWSKLGYQKWFLRAEVEEGRTYYVHLRVVVGGPGGFYGPAGLRPTLINAGADDKRGKKSLKKINKLLAIDPLYLNTGSEVCVLQEPATAEHIEAMQKELGPMIEEVMAEWDEVWTNESRWEVLHESDYVK